jgi:hypothetical protein
VSVDLPVVAVSVLAALMICSTSVAAACCATESASLRHCSAMSR